MTSLTRRHLATLVVAGTVLLAGCGADVNGGAAGVALQQPAPEVRYTLLDGSQVDTQQLKGQVVLVNFWATSCTTCVGEMPQVVATHDRFKGRGFQTLAVSMQYDPPALVSTFAEGRKLPFGVAIDNTGAIAKGFGDVALTPTTFLIDKRGQIVHRWVGTPDFAALQTLVERLLAEA